MSSISEYCEYIGDNIGELYWLGTGLHKISAAHGTMAAVPVIGSSKMVIIDQIDFK